MNIIINNSYVSPFYLKHFGIGLVYHFSQIVAHVCEWEAGLPHLRDSPDASESGSVGDMGWIFELVLSMAAC